MCKVHTITDVETKSRLIQEVRALINEAYAYLGGVPHTDQDLIETPGEWRLVFRDDAVIAGAIYRKHHGMKLRLAFQRGAKEELRKVLEDLFLGGYWVEASCKLSNFLLKHGHLPQPSSLAVRVSDDVQEVISDVCFLKFGKQSQIFGQPKIEEMKNA